MGPPEAQRLRGPTRGQADLRPKWRTFPIVVNNNNNDKSQPSFSVNESPSGRPSSTPEVLGVSKSFLRDVAT